MLGALADFEIQENRKKEYAALLADKKFSVTTLLVENIQSRLEDENYSVVQLSVSRPKVELLKQYPDQSEVAADAYLDVAIMNYGYMAGVITAPYHPIFSVQFKLVRASDKTTLMQGWFGYSIESKDVHPDAVYDFKSYDEIKSDPDRAIKGITAGLLLASDAVADALK